MIFMVGIGGAGMSGIAEVRDCYTASGSDQTKVLHACGRLASSST